MLLVLLTAWLVLALPFAVLVGKGIAMASREEDDAAAYPLQAPPQSQPVLAQQPAGALAGPVGYEVTR